MKLGLSLAGGGVKGAAHIGVLKAFEESKVKIDYISGTSSGSIVSALYACGYNADEIYDIFKRYCKQINYISINNILKLFLGLVFKRKILIQGLNDGLKIEKLMKKLCANKGISSMNQMKMPIIIPSVNLHDGKVYIFTSKETRDMYNDKIEYISDIDVWEAVRASTSYPRCF